MNSQQNSFISLIISKHSHVGGWGFNMGVGDGPRSAHSQSSWRKTRSLFLIENKGTRERVNIPSSPSLPVLLLRQVSGMLIKSLLFMVLEMGKMLAQRPSYGHLREQPSIRGPMGVCAGSPPHVAGHPCSRLGSAAPAGESPAAAPLLPTDAWPRGVHVLQGVQMALG